VEHPDQFAGKNVESANVAGWREIAFTGRAAEDDQVLEHAPCAPRCQRRRGAVDAGLQIQLAVIGEGIDQLAGARVDCMQHAAGRDENAPVRSVFTFPVIRTALPGDAAEPAAPLETVDPKFFARGGIERDELPLLRGHVRNVIDYQRAERVAQIVSRRITPRHRKVGRIGRVDLFQR